MKSPRFDIRAASLRRIFDPKNIERVWKAKVRISMRQQYLNDGVENFDFHVAHKLECEKLSKLILSGQYVPQKGQRILVEKSKGLCRQLVIPSVPDAIVLQALSDFLYSQIKGKAPSPNSFFEMKDHRFSSPKETYGTLAAWLNFQKTLFNFPKNRKFIVVTDISNYYDSISYTHLRNVISSITDAEECVLDMLIFVLSALLWQLDYMPRVEIGLPQMNLDAPRLLAHCFLYELDAFIAGNGDLDFVRYMDDIDIGVNTIVSAKNVLKSIDLVLQTKQVRLNSGKTEILTSEEAIHHFRIMENAYLDEVKLRVDGELTNGTLTANTKYLISSNIRKGLKSGIFNGGNGEKILKRWVGLAGRCGVPIQPNTLEGLIRLRPAVRESVFNYICRSPLTPARAKVLANCVNSKLFVDDAAIVELANNLVETSIVRRQKIHGIITQIMEELNPQLYFEFYAKIWLQSKYDTLEKLIDTIENYRNTWIADDRLGRLVGACRPLFVDTPEYDLYSRMLIRSQNPGFHTTSKFQEMLATSANTFNAMFKPLAFPNLSKGTGITHAKYLCLLSALSNKNVPTQRLSKLTENNKSIFKDVYYKATLRRIGVRQ